MAFNTVGSCERLQLPFLQRSATAPGLISQSFLADKEISELVESLTRWAAILEFHFPGLTIIIDGKKVTYAFICALLFSLHSNQVGERTLYYIPSGLSY